jgi:chorismate mutase/prephenate dehydrogenase
MEPLRTQIDNIDQQIIALLGQRAQISRHIGEYKHAHDLPVHDPQREWDLQERIRELADHYSADPKLCIRLYGLILANSRSKQR